MPSVEKVSDLSFDEIVKMKSSDIYEHCGYGQWETKKFQRDFKKRFGFTFQEYKQNMIGDYISQHHKKMTVDQLAKKLNVSREYVRAKLRKMGIKARGIDTKAISTLLELTEDEIGQTLNDLFPQEYIKIKIKKKVKKTPERLKIKISKAIDHLNFVIKDGRKIVAKGEYHKQFWYNAREEIKKTFLGLI